MKWMEEWLVSLNRTPLYYPSRILVRTLIHHPFSLLGPARDFFSSLSMCGVEEAWITKKRVMVRSFLTVIWVVHSLSRLPIRTMCSLHLCVVWTRVRPDAWPSKWRGRSNVLALSFGTRTSSSYPSSPSERLVFVCWLHLVPDTTLLQKSIFRCKQRAASSRKRRKNRELLEGNPQGTRTEEKKRFRLLLFFSSLYPWLMSVARKWHEWRGRENDDTEKDNKKRECILPPPPPPPFFIRERCLQIQKIKKNQRDSSPSRLRCPGCCG